MDADLPVLVTGAASGIGLAAARAFAATGQNVIGLDRSPAPPELADADWLICDMDDPVALEAALTALTARSFAAAVLCAGVAGVGDPGRVLRINFFATRRIAEALMPRVAEGGAVILMSSGAGMGWPARQEILRPILAASEDDAMPLALAQCPTAAEAYNLSKELLSCYGGWACLQATARGIRINAVSPGAVETPLIPDFARSMGEQAMAFSRSVTGRHGRPDEIAAAVLFLTSPAASWINGADIRVDGGLTGALAAGAPGLPAWN